MLKCPHCNKELQVRIEVLSGSGYHDVDQFYKEETPAPSPAHEKVIDNGVGDQHATFSEGWRTAKVEPTRAVFEFEPNDVVTTTESGSTYLYRGDVCYLFAREDEKQPMVSWCHAGMRNTDERNMHRSEIIELLNKRGITAKFPEATPASDSVKGERDKFGREIIERLGGAFIVKCGDGNCNVSRTNGDWYASIDNEWKKDTRPEQGVFEPIDRSRHRLIAAAASLELPTANPAASAKETDAKRFPDHLANADWRADKERVETDVEGLCHTMREHEERLKEIEKIIDGFHTPAEFSDLRLRVSDLEREVAALKAVK